MNKAELKAMLVFRRCLCCRRRIHRDNRHGYCRRAVCQRRAYHACPELREKILARNAAWHAAHAEQLAEASRRRAARRAAQPGEGD